MLKIWIWHIVAYGCHIVSYINMDSKSNAELPNWH